MLLVGAALLAGFICIVFAVSADLAIHAHQQLMAISPFLTLLVAPAGFALMAWICRRYFPGAQGSGIPRRSPLRSRTITRTQQAAVGENRFRQGIADPRRLALGRRGRPRRPIGAGRRLDTPHPGGQALRSHRTDARPHRGRRRGGHRGGLQHPAGWHHVRDRGALAPSPFIANSTTLIAVIFAGLISLATLGSYTYFGITQAALDWPDGIWPVLLCGAAGGLGGGLFSRLLLATTRALPGRLGVFAKAHRFGWPPPAVWARRSSAWRPAASPTAPATPNRKPPSRAFQSCPSITALPRRPRCCWPS